MSSATTIRALAYRSHEITPVDIDDLQLLVTRRLSEVRQMIRPHRLVRHPWGDFSPELQELVEKYEKLPSRDFLKQRRLRRKAGGTHFKSVVQLLIVLLRSFRNTKRYYENEFEGLSIRSRLLTNCSKSQTSRYSISASSQNCLRSLPECRDKDSIKQIQRLLKATGAFKHLFPMEMELELARYIEFSRYENGRIIAYQARPAECLYFVLTGRINKICQFSLSREDIVQRVGVLRKGQTDNVDEFLHQWPRQSNLIAEDQLEVLILHRQIFNYLRKAAAGLPITFLRSLKYLERLDFTKLQEKPQTVEYRCYRKNEIIASDSNRTPWLHIIKAGMVKVIRHQTVIDVGKLQTGEILSRKHSRSALSASILRRQGRDRESRLCRSANSATFSAYGSNTDSQQLGLEIGDPMKSLLSENSTASTSVLSGSPGYRDSRACDTRLPRRAAFVVLDCLKTGDIFGLDRLRPPLASDPMGLTLLSDGAEVIRISKQFFHYNVDESIIYTADTLSKEYLTEQQVEEKLLTDASWKVYKDMTLRKATENNTKLLMRSARI